jgi:hypothetical protein
MVARVKSTRFRCMLAASLSVLVLAGCGDFSESSQTAQPSKESKPTKTAERHAAGEVLRLQTDPARHARTFLRARCACTDERRQRACTLRDRAGCRRVQADPQRQNRVLAGQP